MKLRAYTSIFCEIALCSSLALACSSSNGSDTFTMGGSAGTNGPDPAAGGASAGSAGHSAGGSSGATSGGSGNAAGSTGVAGSGNAAGGNNTGGTGNVGGSGNAAGAGNAGAGNAGAGGAGGACGNHATDIELVPGPNSTYMEWCFDPCDPTWISITDPNGKNVPLASVACAASPYWLTEGESQLFDGKSSGQCLPAGRYVVKVCTRKGQSAIAEEGSPPAPGNHVEDIPVEPRVPCTPKGDPICESVPFDYPGDSEVTVTLDQ